MNGSKSPAPSPNEATHGSSEAGVTNGQPSSQQQMSGDTAAEVQEQVALTNSTQPTSVLGNDEDAPGEEEDAGSEAETLITSPVKRKEAAKQQGVTDVPKIGKAPRHRIGGLPVPSGDNDDENESGFSTVPSPAGSVEKATSNNAAEDEDMEDADHESDALSSIASGPSTAASNSSPRLRAESENPGAKRSGPQSPNPRKRKHRASSVSLPNKRQSMEAPPRRLRGLHSEEIGHSARSPSPRARSHRRAASTQSAFFDGAAEVRSGRKRKLMQHATPRESNTARPAWEESDASSETTSHGHVESRRLPRGIGRSTSTPGRPAGREHKRFINKYGSTRLAEACSNNNLDIVKEWRVKDPDQLELADNAGNRPLQIAAIEGHVDVVKYLIEQGCQIDCANIDKDTPLLDAAENGHLDVVVALLAAGVDPMRQNNKGSQALDVVQDDKEHAAEIRVALRAAIQQWTSAGAQQRREEEEEQRHRSGPSKELHLLARTSANLLKLVQDNNRAAVREFLDARVGVDNDIIAAAARTGDSYLVSMLLAEMTEDTARVRAHRPILSVLGTSQFEMVEFLTGIEWFNPLYRNPQGQNWAEIAEAKQGPHWPKEKALLQRLHDAALAKQERPSSSPVTKRDGLKRRVTHRPAEDESDEEEEKAPKRKHGRRLMSKRDMRAASGKAEATDESEEEVESEESATAAEQEPETKPEPAEEGTMKPPGSPPAKRKGRARSSSSSAAGPAPTSPRTRRRSSSFRGAAETASPTLDETMEDVESAAAVMEKKEAERASVEAVEHVEENRREDEVADALSEEDPKDIQQRQAAREEAQQRQAEETRRAEELHKAEEENQRAALERAEAHRIQTEKVLQALPSAISHVLDPASGFDYDSPDAAAYLTRQFTPLQVFHVEEFEREHAAHAYLPAWVSNLQAAPLLGPRGLQLICGGDEQLPFLNDEAVAHSAAFIADLPLHEDEASAAVEETYEGLLARLVEHQHTRAAHQRRVKTSIAELHRLVRLEDVFAHLHPCLEGVKIEVRLDWYRMPLRNAAWEAQKEGFVDALAGMLERRFKARTYVDGEVVDWEEGRSARGTTAVAVVRQK